MHALRQDDRLDGLPTPARVLVADDSEPFRRAAAAVVDAAGFALVGSAGTGEDAIHAVEATGADIVLLDVRMPGIGGVEAARRIRSVRPDTIVVLLTGEPGFEAPDVADAVLDKRDFRPDVLTILWQAHAPAGSSVA
jgi:CheY-like chemotaxis protein